MLGSKCIKPKKINVNMDDTIIDNLRLEVYLNKTLNKNINGMNFINSSAIMENIKDTIVTIFALLFPTSGMPQVPNRLVSILE